MSIRQLGFYFFFLGLIPKENFILHLGIVVPLSSPGISASMSTVKAVQICPTRYLIVACIVLRTSWSMNAAQFALELFFQARPGLPWGPTSGLSSGVSNESALPHPKIVPFVLYPAPQNFTATGSSPLLLFMTPALLHMPRSQNADVKKHALVPKHIISPSLA